MIYQLSVPAVVPDVVEIRVLEWHGTVGQVYEAGDLIVELETHKAIVEIRAGQPGVLRQILSEAGSWQKIGVPLALFSDQDTEVLPTDHDAIENLSVEFEIT